MSDGHGGSFTNHNREGKSTMKIKIGKSKVSVFGKRSVLAVQSNLFLKWTYSLSSSFSVKRIEIQSVDTVIRGGKEEVLFLKIKAEIVDAQGRCLPGIVFLRGASVGIFIVLNTLKDKYVVLIESCLPAIGKISFPQLPAGMMDKEVNPLKVAIREMKEETGLDPHHGKLTDLGKSFYGSKWSGIYPSPGACDEMIHLFLYEQNVSERKIKELQGLETGLSEEHEHLKLRVVRLSQLCECTPDVKAHSAYLMYTHLKLRGQL